MSLEKSKAIVRSLYEVLNKHNPDLLDEFMASDYVDAPNTPFELRGLESVKQYYADVYRGFPDFHGTIGDIIAEGDKVWAHITFTGTHTGKWNFFGIILAPTGKKVTYKSVTIKRVVDGKMVEGWTVNDMLDFLRQLGVIEYTEKAKNLFLGDVS